MREQFHAQVDNEFSGGHAWATFHDRCRELIVSNRYTEVCEVGGGRTPLFMPGEVDELSLHYTILDISQTELDHAPANYHVVRADISDLGISGGYDFMFSKMLAEHVADGAAMHRNILRLLNPGGIAFHFFPTLYHPVFVVNRIMPELLSRTALLRLSSNRASDSKFPAYYSQCYGPSARRRALYEAMGYQVVEYRPFYGTAYLRRVPVLRSLEDAFGRVAAGRRSPHFSSYAWLILRKPAIAAMSPGQVPVAAPPR